MKEEKNMTKEYKQIEGVFTIMKDGRLLINKKELEDDAVVHLSVKAIRHIIKDAKENII